MFFKHRSPISWKMDLHDFADLIVDGLRDADTSRLGKLLETNRNVDAGAVEVVVLGPHRQD
jgi:hypothetical protein